NLDENNFTVVPTTVLSKMKNLRILYMMDNNIQEINESWIHENLRTLELDRNEIKKFPRLMMPRLNKLSLRDNKIEEIPENALKNTKMLEML
ncbi:slit homolog 3, partial [Paramuricea clavata]